MRQSLLAIRSLARNNPEAQGEILICLLTTGAIGLVIIAGIVILDRAGILGLY